MFKGFSVCEEEKCPRQLLLVRIMKGHSRILSIPLSRARSIFFLNFLYLCSTFFSIFFFFCEFLWSCSKNCCAYVCILALIFAITYFFLIKFLKYRFLAICSNFLIFFIMVNFYNINGLLQCICIKETCKILVGSHYANALIF